MHGYVAVYTVFKTLLSFRRREKYFSGNAGVGPQMAVFPFLPPTLCKSVCGGRGGGGGGVPARMSAAWERGTFL